MPKFRSALYAGSVMITGCGQDCTVSATASSIFCSISMKSTLWQAVFACSHAIASTSSASMIAIMVRLQPCRFATGSSGTWRKRASNWGPIRLLTMPRILGYAFNPLSIYFCHRCDKSLSAIFYEVNNTFGQRHNYLIPVPSGIEGLIRQESRKSFYVSPFMTTDMVYLFSVMPPGTDLAVSVIGRDEAGPLMIAKLAAVRQDLTDASLARAFCAYPLLTLKVIAGIYWEALLIWLKKIGLQERPSLPDRPVTLGRCAKPEDNRREKSITNGL